MRNLIVTICLYFLISLHSQAQESHPKTQKELLNHVVGGTWISTNEQNEGKPEDYKSFYMSFENWSDDASVTGSISGIKNRGDTVQLIEIWNFLNEAEDNIFYVHRTTWGWYSLGAIKPYLSKHLDIQFKTRTPDGQEFYTRDLHYLDTKDSMSVITYHRLTQDDEWEEVSTSTWTRKLNKL
ncbi:MAG: hypothetical protein RJQ14_09380 [Marinoscillum sp.]